MCILHKWYPPKTVLMCSWKGKRNKHRRLFNVLLLFSLLCIIRRTHYTLLYLFFFASYAAAVAANCAVVCFHSNSKVCHLWHSRRQIIVKAKCYCVELESQSMNCSDQSSIGPRNVLIRIRSLCIYPETCVRLPFSVCLSFCNFYGFEPFYR